jgi:hypothetical protein
MIPGRSPSLLLSSMIPVRSPSLLLFWEPFPCYSIQFSWALLGISWYLVCPDLYFYFFYMYVVISFLDGKISFIYPTNIYYGLTTCEALGSMWDTQWTKQTGLLPYKACSLQRDNNHSAYAI